MVQPTETGTKVYASNMTTIHYNYSSYLQETLNYLKSIKIKCHLEDNVTDFCAAILVEAGNLESDGAFNPYDLVYITRISENNSDPRYHLWETHKYNVVMDFTKKICVCDEDVM